MLNGPTPHLVRVINSDAPITPEQEGRAFLVRVVGDALSKPAPAGPFPTRAVVTEATIDSGMLAIETAGYSAPGDFGGAKYKRVSSEPAHAGKVQSADGVWWEQIFDDSINPHQFGAKGDAVTDDTAAILAADAFVRTGKGTLNFYPRIYLVGPLVLGGGPWFSHNNCTWRGIGYDGRGIPQLAATLLLKAGAGGSLIYLAANSGHYIFERLIFHADKAKQTGGFQGCIYVAPVDPLPAGTYPYSLHMRFCHVYGGLDFGIYIGRNRGWTSLEDVDVQYHGRNASSAGIVIDSYDAILNRVHVGNVTGNGIKLDHTSQVWFTDVATFFCSEQGVYITGNCSDFSWKGGSVDRNPKNGIKVEANVNPTYRGGRTLFGVRFLGNSKSASGTYSDVVSSSATDALTLFGCDFMGDEGDGIKPAYYLNWTDSLGNPRAYGCNFKGGGAVSAQNVNRLANL